MIKSMKHTNNLKRRLRRELPGSRRRVYYMIHRARRVARLEGGATSEALMIQLAREFTGQWLVLEDHPHFSLTPFETRKITLPTGRPAWRAILKVWRKQTEILARWDREDAAEKSVSVLTRQVHYVSNLLTRLKYLEDQIHGLTKGSWRAEGEDDLYQDLERLSDELEALYVQAHDLIDRAYARRGLREWSQTAREVAIEGAKALGVQLSSACAECTFLLNRLTVPAGKEVGS